MSSDFQHEYEIINRAMKLIESENKHDKIDFPVEYRNLTKNYKRLLRQLVKLTTISDKLQRKLISTQDDLKELIITDSLTNLYNRRKLDETLALRAANYIKNSSPFSVIIIDIDEFKKVNDLHGHHVGDLVLIEFSNLIKANIDSSNILGRWGGEEFMIISTNLNFEETIKSAEKLRKMIEEFNFPVVGKKTASFGIAEFMKERSIDDLIIRADKALYLAKKNGRNRVETIY